MSSQTNPWVRLLDGRAFEDVPLFWRQLGPDGRLRNLDWQFRNELVDAATDSLDLARAFDYAGA